MFFFVSIPMFLFYHIVRVPDSVSSGTPVMFVCSGEPAVYNFFPLGSLSLYQIYLGGCCQILAVLVRRFQEQQDRLWRLLSRFKSQTFARLERLIH